MQPDTPVAPRPAGASLLGIALLVIGVVLLLNNLDVWDVDLGDVISRGWPLILVFLGLKHLLRRSTSTGVVLLLLGVAFELAAWDLLAWRSIRQYWPVGLIMLGVWLIFSRGGGSARGPSPP